MTHEIVALLAQYGLALVFATVLIQQIGFPVPAVPVMVIAGSLAPSGHVSLASVVLFAFVACMAGDLAWYWAGRRYGEHVLRALCRMSLSPDSCVYQSELRFERWRGRVLVAAKFVPGLSLVAPPLAGALGLGLVPFAVFDAVGALLWIGVAVAVGFLFSSRINQLLGAFATAGGVALAALIGLVVLYLLWRWWRRWRVAVALRVPHIQIDELLAEIESDAAPLIIDVRSDIARRADPRIIPGARPANARRIERAVRGVARERPIAIYCSCPNEATSSRAAKRLMALGFRAVRAVEGGLPAWEDAGLPVEQLVAKAGAEGSARAPKTRPVPAEKPPRSRDPERV